MLLLKYRHILLNFKTSNEELKRLLKIYEISEKENSILSATKKLNGLGIKGKNGKDLHCYSLACILQRAMYSGYIEHNGELYKSSHIPILIPAERYNKMQLKLYKKAKNNKSRLFVILDDQKVMIKELTDDQMKKI